MNGPTGQAFLILAICGASMFGLTLAPGLGHRQTLSHLAKGYRALHGWIGITTGSLLAMGFLAGTFTLFAAPLQQWSLPPLPSRTLAPLAAPLPAPTPPGGNRAAPVRLTLTSTSTARTSLLLAPELPLGLPAPHYLPCQPAGVSRCALVLLPSAVPSFIGGLHRRMGLPVPERWAIPLVGLLCLFYGLALLSGIILLLPGIWRTLMTVRLQGHARRLWLDLHSLLGLCTLPFHLVIALTSALFAFAPLLSPQPGAVQPATIPLRTQPAPDGLQAGASSIPPMQALSRLHDLAPGFHPLAMEYIPPSHRADSLSLRLTLHAPPYSAGERETLLPAAGAYLSISGTDPHAPLIGRDRGSVLLDSHDGHILATQNLPGQQTPARRMLTWCLALHFGSFGGEFIRWLYVALGLCGVGFFHTANQLWLNSHRRKPHGQGSPVDTPATLWLGRLSEGSLLGCLLGLAALTLASPFMARIHPASPVMAAGWTSPDGPAPVMLQAWGQVSLLYYGAFSLTILARCLLPPRPCRVAVLALSALCLTLALGLVINRHMAAQTPETLSLSCALTLASLGLWAAALRGFWLMTSRG